jgi:FkbM family methyltransferase
VGKLILRIATLAARVLPRWLTDALYRLGPASRGLRRLLNRAAAPGYQEVVIASGLLQGARLKLDLQEEKSQWLGTFEPALQEALRRHLTPGMVFFDVGANLGYLTVGAALLVRPKGEVHAFEPLPNNVHRLLDALKRNDLGGVVNVIPAAVGERSGRGGLLLHRSQAMAKLEGSLGRPAQYSQSQEVRVISLDDYVYGESHQAPDWIKIDVEGGEGMVLRGMKRLLREARPHLVLEIHGSDAAEEVFDELTGAGYVLSPLGEPLKKLLTAAELPWRAYLKAEPSGNGWESR